MSDTLAQLIVKVRANFQDDGTLFPDAALTAALRQALNDLNQAVPLHAAVTITAIADQREYELSDEDPDASGITDVLLDGDHEYATGLAYNAYVEDDRWFFRLRNPVTAGETLIVQYTRPHTISGLDGSLDSTLPDDLDAVMVTGACYYACISRAAVGIEANTVESLVAANWMKLAGLWQGMFVMARAFARRAPTAKGEPGEALAWNDPEHDPEYP